MDNMYYVGLLGNVNKSILNIDLGFDYKIEEWSAKKYISLHAEIFGLPEDEVRIQLFHNYGYEVTNQGKYYRIRNVYVVTKDLSSSITNTKDTESKFDNVMSLHSVGDWAFRYVDKKIHLLRLFQEGTIKIGIAYTYTIENGEATLFSATQDHLFCHERLYSLNKTKFAHAQSFINKSSLYTSHEYISLALNNFYESYRVFQPQLEFLISMMALETLFNDGRQELRHKIARNCAVLLGKTPKESREIFKNAKMLYDKRSALVHTGKPSEVDSKDILAAKHLVRESLKEVLYLDLAKDELTALLNEFGFGSNENLRKLKKIRRKRVPRQNT